MVHFLAPFYRTTLRLQAATIPTLQQTFETYEGLFNSIDNVRGIFENMRLRLNWIQDIEMGINAMWKKLKVYYSDTKPYVYGDAILLHPSEKLRWLKRHEWDSIKIEEYRESTSRRFELKYARPAMSEESRKRSFEKMIVNSDSDDDIQSEFESYIRQGRTKGISNPLIWWKGVNGMYPQLFRMAKDTFAVPATGSGVEREFSISGILVSKTRNRLDPMTISDLMQYKRWLARTGISAKFLQYQIDVTDRDIPDTNTSSAHSESEAEELNQELIDWLAAWEEEEELISRGTRLEPIA